MIHSSLLRQIEATTKSRRFRRTNTGRPARPSGLRFAPPRITCCTNLTSTHCLVYPRSRQFETPAKADARRAASLRVRYFIGQVGLLPLSPSSGPSELEFRRTVTRIQIPQRVLARDDRTSYAFRDRKSACGPLAAGRIGDPRSPYRTRHCLTNVKRLASVNGAP